MAGLWKTNKNKAHPYRQYPNETGEAVRNQLTDSQRSSPTAQIRQTEILGISKPPGYAQAIRSLMHSVHSSLYSKAFNFISKHIAVDYLLCQPNKMNLPASHFYPPSLNLYIFTFSVSRSS